MSFDFLQTFKDLIDNDPLGKYTGDFDGDGDDEKIFKEYNTGADFEEDKSPYLDPKEDFGSGTSITETPSFDALYGYLLDAVEEQLLQRFQNELYHPASAYDPQQQQLSEGLTPLEAPSVTIIDTDYFEATGDPGVFVVKEGAEIELQYDLTLLYPSSNIGKGEGEARLQLKPDGNSSFQAVSGTNSGFFLRPRDQAALSGAAILSLGAGDKIRAVADYQKINDDGSDADLIKRAGSFNLVLTATG
jgi:hypothetical protein